MTGPASGVESIPGSLLSKEQVRTCQDLTAPENGVASQRAAALLSLNGGSTQIKAATDSGLTIGQVRYLLYTFKRKGMMVFPSGKELVVDKNIAITEPKTKVLAETTEGIVDNQPSEEKSEKKRSKKDKGKDKGSKKKTKKKNNKKNAKKKKSKKKKKNK